MSLCSLVSSMVFCTRLRSTSAANGLRMKSAAPAWSPAVSVFTSSSPVRKMTGTLRWAESVRMCFSRSKPFASGMYMSSKKRSGGAPLSRNASRSLPERRYWPSIPSRSNIRLTILKLMASSSTTTTRSSMLLPYSRSGRIGARYHYNILHEEKRGRRPRGTLQGAREPLGPEAHRPDRQTW